jgi:hypothetical protein
MDADLLPAPEIDPLAMLPEVTPYGRTWVDKTVTESAPPPIITALETHEAGWCWWPPAVLTLEKRARLAGHAVRIGFARGYKPGRAKNTWDLWDTIGVWCQKDGCPRVVFTWERSPDAANEWKAAKASFRGANGRVLAVNHTAGKGML